MVLTAAIWGVAFVAQSEGGDVVGPFSFNCVRFIIGAAVLVPVIGILDRAGLSVRRPQSKQDKVKTFCYGALAGAALFLAANAQQFAISMGAEVSKAGFLTALYIIMVPILGFFFKKKCGWNIWVGVLVSIVGLYFLCLTDGAGFKVMDLLLLACAFLFSIQILMIDRFAPLTDPVRLSSVQFLVCGLLSAIPALIFDVPRSGSFAALMDSFSGWDAWIPILYAGVLSSGVAYTLQVVAQPGLNPTVASLIMSFEAVFATLSGWLILHQTLSVREIMGCVLMFAAIVIAQLPLPKNNLSH